MIVRHTGRFGLAFQVQADQIAVGLMNEPACDDVAFALYNSAGGICRRFSFVKLMERVES